jgi:hypothetical protein
VKNGTHPFVGDKNPTYKRSKDGSQSAMASKLNLEKVLNGTHQFLGIGKGSWFKSRHFDSCKNKLSAA